MLDKLESKFFPAQPMDVEITPVMCKLYVRSGKPQTAKDLNAQLIAVEVFFLTPSVCYTNILQHATTLSGATVKKRQTRESQNCIIIK